MLRKLRQLRQLMQSLREVDEYVLEKQRAGIIADTRIDELMKATLNGEQEWFLTLVKDDPECAIKLLKECNTDETESS